MLTIELRLTPIELRLTLVPYETSLFFQEPGKEVELTVTLPRFSPLFSGEAWPQFSIIIIIILTTAKEIITPL